MNNRIFLLTLMNNQPIKPLSDYSDEELVNEITRRINTFSFDLIHLLIPMVVIGSQYYHWYEEKRKETNPNEDK